MEAQTMITATFNWLLILIFVLIFLSVTMDYLAEKINKIFTKKDKNEELEVLERRKGW